MVCIGVDIGGSGWRAAVRQGGALGELRRTQGIPEQPDELVARIVDDARALGEVACLGVAVPGFVRDGVILGSPNLPQLAGFDLRAALRRELNAPVTVLNDANAAAMGAWAELQPAGDLLVLTLGTGVGGGLIVNGRPFLGGSQTATELGHVYIGGQQRCGCGAVGCLETWVGTAGLVRRAAALGHAVEGGAALVAAAEAGELWAQSLLHDAGNALGQGLRGFLNLFGPQSVVISGGLAGAESWLRPAVDRIVREQGIRPNVEGVALMWRPDAAQWAILGAAAAAEGGD